MDSVQISRTPNGGMYIVINGYAEGFAGLNNIKFKRRGTQNKISVIGEHAILFTFDYPSITLIEGVIPPNNINDGVLRLTDLFSGSNAYTDPTATKFNQTITFVAPASVPHAHAPFALAAFSSSGLPISYASSDVTKFTIAGNILTPVAAGTANITASQAGDANYNAAADVVHAYTLT